MLLERGFGSLWLEAEISNFARPSSGHWYFSLKDAAAQVRCCMFRQRNMLLRFAPRDGQKVLVRARIGLYEPRGEYQLVIDHMEDAGLGALKRQFDELAAKLAAEGLFAPERKRPLPTLPKRIGVITSPKRRRDSRHPARAGAALRRRSRVDLSGRRAGRRGRAEIVAALEAGRPAGGMRCAHFGARRRLARGFVGLQRRGAGARHRRLVPFRWSAASVMRSTSPSPISPPTCAPRRLPPRRKSWCPTPKNGSHPCAAWASACGARMRRRIASAQRERLRWLIGPCGSWSAPRRGLRSSRNGWTNWSSACRARCARSLADRRSALGLRRAAALWQLSPAGAAAAARRPACRACSRRLRARWPRATASRPRAARAAGAHLERRESARHLGSRLCHRQPRTGANIARRRRRAAGNASSKRA